MPTSASKNGTKNPSTIVDAATRAVLKTAAHIQEQRIEEEMQVYDRLLDDDDAIEQLRIKRIQQLKQNAARHQSYLDAGHGQYTELSGIDIAKEFFNITKLSSRVVVHFYKPSSSHVCDIFHKHLQKLASKHLETRFIKINVESCLDDSLGSSTSNGVTFLVERLHVAVMPTLILIKDRLKVHSIQGFDELGGSDQFNTNKLAYVLRQHGLLEQSSDEDDDESPDGILASQSYKSRGKNGSLGSITMTKNKKWDNRRGMYDLDDDDSFT